MRIPLKGSDHFSKQVNSAFEKILEAYTESIKPSTEMRKATAMLGREDIPYWFISRTGPDGAQDADFEVDQVIKMASFLTDVPQLVIENNTPIRGTQNLIFQGDYNYNYHIAS